MVRLDRAFIRILKGWLQSLRRRRHKAFCPPVEFDSSAEAEPDQDRGPFPDNVCHLIRNGLVEALGGPKGRMAANPNHLGDNFETENTGGLLSGFLAEEDSLDRRSLWRLGSWGVGTVAAVVVAVLANQSALRSHMDLVASDDLARQAQQLRTAAREGQNEARRLASAVDTLNADRDRLYSRVTVLEQGLDSVTGSIARQNSAASSLQAVPAPAEPQSAAQAPPPPADSPVVAPVANTTAATTDKPAASAAAEPAPTTVASVEPASSSAPASANAPAATPATSLMPSKSMMAPPDSAAGKLIRPEPPASAVIASPIPEVVASAKPADTRETDATDTALAVQRTEFAVDVGSASSLAGLRALWRGLLKSNNELTPLRPLISIKETGNGFGMQLRLVIGPLHDAAAAAKICATLIEGQRTCETTLFDGQRLLMRPDASPVAARPAAPRRHFAARRPPPSPEPPKKPDVSTLSALFGRR